MFAPFEDGRPDIGKKRLFETFLGVDLLIAFLVARELFVIHRGGFDIQFLRSKDFGVGLGFKNFRD